MLPIPLKNGSTVDLARPLKAFINIEYSTEEANSIDADCKALDRLRTVAMQARASTEESIVKLQSYLAHFNRAAALFPFSAGAVPVAFTWHDAFRPSRKISAVDTSLEKAAILFNMGAVKSSIAASADRTCADGIKLSCREFQIAAGIFKHIREQIVPHISCTLSSDLSQDGLLMVERILLAQAQACFYEKAVQDAHRGARMKSSIIARLATQAAEMYGEALRFGESQTMTANGLDSSWPLTLRFQQDLYTAIAQYYQSETAKEAAEQNGSGFGEQVVRLRVAQRYIDGVMEMIQRLRMGPVILNRAEQLRAKIVQSRTGAEKDNSTIYMEILPHESSLIAIGQICMVKPIGAEYPPPDKLLFPNILTKVVRERAIAVRKTSGALSASADKAAKEATDFLHNQLSMLGLPGALEAHQSPSGLPQATWKKLQNLREKRSTVSELEGRAMDLEKAASHVANLVLRIAELLRTEQQRDYEFRQHYAPSGQPDQPGNQLLHITEVELAHFRELFRDAQRKDNELQSKVQQLDPESLLSASRQELDARLTGPTSAAKIDTGDLSRAMLDMAKCLQSRDSALRACKDEEQSRYNRLTERLLRGDDCEIVASEYLQQLDSLKSAIDESIQQQSSLLEKIREANASFVAQRDADPATLARDRLLQDIESRVLSCHEVHAQLTEGMEFYASLATKLQQILLSTEDMQYTADLQRKEHEMQYARQQTATDPDSASRVFAELRLNHSAPAGQDIMPPPPFYPHSGPPQLENPIGAHEPVQQSPPPYPPPPYAPEYTASYGPGRPLPQQQSPAGRSTLRPGGVRSAEPHAAVVDPVQQLVDMGFAERAVRQALAASNGDVQSALNSLLRST